MIEGTATIPILRRLYARLGPRVVRRLILFGEELSGQSAYDAGVVEQVVAADALRHTATRVAEHALHGVPAAIAAAKGFFNDLERDIFNEDHWQAERHRLMQAPERQAFVDQNRPGKQK